MRPLHHTRRLVRACASLLALVLVVPVALVGTVGPPAPALAQSVAASEILAPPPLDASTLGVPPSVSAVLVEVATGQAIVARDADLRRPIASTLKLVTALAVVAALPPGSLIAVGAEVQGVEGSAYGLRPGEVRSVEDLLAGLLLRSGNDAALALAVAIDGSEDAFLDRMAGVLADLGIAARPETSSGLGYADALSATELAVVAIAALAEPRIRDLVAVPVLTLADGTPVENRNQFLRDVGGATGLKTGFTSAAGYTLAASAVRDGRELVAVVLGAVDDRTRRDIAGRLLEHGFTMTTPTALVDSITLRTAAGPVRLAPVDTVMTLAAGSAAVLDWPATLRSDASPASIDVLVDGARAGSVEVVRQDGRRATVAPSLGRALVDGVYAALRPSGLSDALR